MKSQEAWYPLNGSLANSASEGVRVGRVASFSSSVSGSTGDVDETEDDAAFGLRTSISVFFLPILAPGTGGGAGSAGTYYIVCMMCENIFKKGRSHAPCYRSHRAYLR
jgi:hypothetical protein